MQIISRKKFFAALLALVFGSAFCTGGLAVDSGASFSAKGTIQAVEQATLVAPMGGRVEPFDWKPGDEAEAGDTALTLTPIQAFAASDGIIRGLRANVGDQAAQVIAQYGAMCYIERDGVWRVRASASSAYDEVENRDVRIGDVLRVRQGSGDKEVTGTGTVIALAARGFVVELEKGDFELEEGVKLYRGIGKDFDRKKQVGHGDIERAEALAVLGDGCIAEVLVEEGQRVTLGQALFTLDAADARHAEPAQHEVVFDRPAVLAEVLVRPGQFVAQGQAVLTVLPSDALEASLEVDELDIARVSVGQRVRVTVDAYPNNTYVGTVREIKPLGQIVLDTTKFLVKVQLEGAEGLMIGMHATGYWE